MYQLCWQGHPLLPSWRIYKPFRINEQLPEDQIIQRTLRAVLPSPSQVPLASRIRGRIAVAPRGRQNFSRARNRTQIRAQLWLSQQP